jgi:hypothetical protein
MERRQIVQIGSGIDDVGHHQDPERQQQKAMDVGGFEERVLVS